MEQTFEHDPHIASELRDGVGREIVEEAAEDERLTALHDRRRFGLSEVAKEMANRGDRASVEFGGHSFSGAVVSAGVDYAVLEGSGLKTEVRLDAAYWSMIPVGEVSSPGSTTNETLAARLAEHSEQGNTVRLAIPAGQLVIGKVAVVADDHIELTDPDGKKLYVPLTMILAITTSTGF